jgi:MFS family permease
VSGGGRVPRGEQAAAGVVAPAAPAAGHPPTPDAPTEPAVTPLPGGPRRRATRYGWLPLVALGSTVALEAGERQSLSHAIDGIQRSFGVSDAAMGWLPFAMAVVGLAGAVPIGILADRARRTLLLGVAMAVWTLTMGLTGLATSYVLLFVARMGVGAVEANGPATVSLIADYYPARDRARMMGLYQAGAIAGALIGLIGGGIAVGVGGWRWAFFMWVPLGLAVTAFVLRQPEPARGDQDADFGDDLAPGAESGDLARMARMLPPPEREPLLTDYRRASTRDVLRELFRIRSMWLGVLALTVSSLMLNALQFWAVPYFRRVHDLEPAAAGAVTGLLGMGAMVGILSGGILADRLLRRGILCARVYVVAAGSVGATLVLLPALASSTLLVTAPLFLVGGALLTLPVAPAEAWVSDVVVAQLRGRASTVRSFVRTLAHIGPVLAGLLSTFLMDSAGMDRGDALRWALVGMTPLYGIGGLLALFAVRSYPADLAFVLAQSRRARSQEGSTPT